MSGSNTTDAAGVYGTKNIAASGNVPTARANAITWMDSSGNLWLFGGNTSSTNQNARSNDLWKYNPATQLWTWASGSNAVNASGVYGAKGVAAAGNVPGARSNAVSWTDKSGNLWMFGGFGMDAMSNTGYLNDLWVYKPSTALWTWMGGVNSTNSLGVYGTQGIANIANMPGARGYGVSWVDSTGNLWLFGGYGIDGSSFGGHFNDLWKYDPAMGLWTWISGADTSNAISVYGTQGIAAASNVLGARSRAVSWIDIDDNLWLFGGTSTSADFSNDLWVYKPSTGLWTWAGGSSVDRMPGSYGTQGAGAIGNMPGGRISATAWMDSAGHLWLLGGYGIDSAGAQGYLNDLWLYRPSTGLWTWVKGSHSINPVGIYTILGTAKNINVPGGRYLAASWIDSFDHLWLFGGEGYDSGSAGLLNDLWVYQR